MSTWCSIDLMDRRTAEPLRAPAALDSGPSEWKNCARRCRARSPRAVTVTDRRTAEPLSESASVTSLFLDVNDLLNVC